MTKRVLIIGGGVGEVQVALDLADSGIPITLIEESSCLHLQGDNGRSLAAMPALLRAANHPNIELVTNATVARVLGDKGDFKVRVNRQPRYIDLERCTSCGKCEQVCPVDVISSTDLGSQHKAVHRPFGIKSVPSSPCIDRQGVSPCTAACPAGVNAHGYVALVSQGKFDEALELILDSAPFPRVLGRVCNHVCETECTRGQVDAPVSICALKRFVADANPAIRSPGYPVGGGVEMDGKARVAIIGAGPAGLTAARELARLGHRSTVFEALPEPGGMTTVGIPHFRLPLEVRRADIDDILSQGGIEIRTSTRIGTDLTIDDLKHQGYEAILIAVGAHRNQKLGIQGERLQGVIDSITLLEAFNLKKPISVGSRVIVIGGGYTGIDSARTAVRLVSSTRSSESPSTTRVLCVDLCAKEDLPANPDEVAQAEAEGVEFDYLVKPLKIIGKDGRVTGVEFRRMKVDGTGMSGGRRHVVPIDSSEFIVEADTVVVAVGQRPDLSCLEGEPGLIEGKRHISVHPVTMATEKSGIFAAGDAAHECGPMVNAVAAGRRAAIAIDKYLRGEKTDGKVSYRKVVPCKPDFQNMYIPPIERHPMPLLRFEDRTDNFEEVELGFSCDMAVEEARRCLHCSDCSECRQCETVCELNAVDYRMTADKLDLENVAVAVVSHSVAEANPMLAKLLNRRGVYTLAPASGEEAVARASAVAARIMVALSDIRRVPGQAPPHVHDVTDASHGSGAIQEIERRKGLFVCGCGGSISDIVDVPAVVNDCKNLRDVVYSSRIGYACSDEAAEEIRRIVEEKGLTDVIVAACACCNLDQICFSCSDRRLRCKSNLLKDSCHREVAYEFVNIREHCAWVHRDDPAGATEKAGLIIAGGVARSGGGPLPCSEPVTVEPDVLVIGDGCSGRKAAEYLAAQGFATTMLTGNGELSATNQLVKKGVNVVAAAAVRDICSYSGSYLLTVAGNGKPETVLAGVVIIDAGTDAGNIVLPSALQTLIDDKTAGNGSPYSIESRLPGVFICSPDRNKGESQLPGEAASARAAVLLNCGKRDIVQQLATVDENKCRGCGTCVSLCPFQAAVLAEDDGVTCAAINNALCRGCGLCVAHCPSGAMSQAGCSDEYLTDSLEAMLS